MKNIYTLTSVVLATTIFASTSVWASSPRESRVERTTTTHANVSLQQEIQAQITSDPLLRRARIEVVEEGPDTIILKGTVDSERAYERALTIAYSIQGVKNVEVRQLEVKCPAHPNEDYIKAARVRGILISEGIIPVEYVHREFVEWPVHVIVEEGVVTVAGFVENEGIRARIATRLRNVPDVGTVRTTVRVQSGAATGTSVTGTGVTGTTDSTSTTNIQRRSLTTDESSATQSTDQSGATTERRRRDSTATERNQDGSTATQRNQRDGSTATQRNQRDGSTANQRNQRDGSTATQRRRSDDTSTTRRSRSGSDGATSQTRQQRAQELKDRVNERVDELQNQNPSSNPNMDTER